MVITLNLQQAANFLHMHQESVRRLAQLGILPAAKPGKNWVFIEEDLANWLRSIYSQERKAFLGEKSNNQGYKLCHSKNVVKSGILNSRHRMVSELDVLLERK